MTEKGPYVGGLPKVFILLNLYNYCAVVRIYKVTRLIASNTNIFLLHIIMLLENMMTHSQEIPLRINSICTRLFLNYRILHQQDFNFLTKQLSIPLNCYGVSFTDIIY